MLLAGRKLFWLFAAAIGFIGGLQLADRLYAEMPVVNTLLVGLLLGVLGALLAIMLQQLTLTAAAFAAGGYIAVVALETLGLDPGRLAWLPFVVAGLVSALLLGVVFDWTLIILSALAGAIAIVDALGLALEPGPALLLLAALAGLGAAVQGGLLARDQRAARRRLGEESRPPVLRRS
jgi:hypothetical protein